MVKLSDIIENKKEEIVLEKKQESLEQLKEKIKTLLPTRDFLGSLSKNGTNIIAETKIDAPTMPNKLSISMPSLAREYELGGAAAISVLTDRRYFSGSKEIMQEIKKRTTNKPIFRKDFIIDEYQIYQSRAYGADAILLISSILSKDKIKKFIELSRKLGMECLVEFHDKKDLKKIPKIAKIYGRNYRKIKPETDFDTREEDIHEDIRQAPDYIESIPANSIKVAESCIKVPEDITYLKDKGFNAFLIGTAISGADDIKKTLKDFLS